MKKNYTQISVILDRTGSMEKIRNDTIGGFNAFLNEQKEQSGKATLTLVQFDTQNPYEVIHQFAAIKDINELSRATYVPRASTPLLDAIGRGINDLEERLTKLGEERPEKVVFVIITDGQENASREFKKDQIVKMINEKQEKDKWQFVFLSADLNSVNDALNYGFKGAATMSYDKTAKGASSAWSSLSSKIKGFRGGKAEEVAFDDEDRAKQESESKR
jgi:hypothetical protein